LEYPRLLRLLMGEPLLDVLTSHRGHSWTTA
jgi:hypothetical protein